MEWLLLPRSSEPSLKLDHSNCGQPVLMKYLLSLILIFYLCLYFPGSLFLLLQTTLNPLGKEDEDT